MGNSNQPKQMPNQNNSTQAPKRDDKNFGNQQKDQVRPGQAAPNTGIKSPNQK